MAEGLMPIGMFSRASVLSIKALREYHRAGILAGIAASIEQVQAGVSHPASHTPVHIRDEPASLTVEYPGTVPSTAGYGPFLDRAYPTLYTVLARVGMTPAGSPGALYPAVLDEPYQVCAYLPISAPTSAGRWTPGQDPEGGAV